jgi:hypothetical protein
MTVSEKIKLWHEKEAELVSHGTLHFGEIATPPALHVRVERYIQPVAQTIAITLDIYAFLSKEYHPDYRKPLALLDAVKEGIIRYGFDFYAPFNGRGTKAGFLERDGRLTIVEASIFECLRREPEGHKGNNVHDLFAGMPLEDALNKVEAALFAYPAESEEYKRQRLWYLRKEADDY